MTPTEAAEQAIESYLEQLDDPGEVDAGDLAENVVIHLRRVGILAPAPE